MILVHTSAWVEYDRATGSAVDQKLTELIRTGGAEVAVTEPVLMEVLSGAADGDNLSRLRRLLTSFQWVAVDLIADFEGAAKIYRTCRAAGISPRDLIDCLVANVAVRTGHPILAVDRDFASIARVVPLRLAAS